jgi:BirA family biotin operon repressor/biotin-[acetyl-CoA-carboxylase] ligase
MTVGGKAMRDATERKLAGVLTETRVEAGRVAEAVVGMGLNLRTGAAEHEAPGAVALAALVAPARVPTAAALADAALAALAEECDRLADADGCASVLERFRSACAMWGRPVRYHDGARAIEAEARDVAEDGGLVVRLASGALAVVHAGDVHLVPVRS